MKTLGSTLVLLLAIPPVAVAQNPPPGTRQISANYDFVPGQRTLFYTDFTDEEVGNFPRRLQFKSGSMEVVELDGKRALKASDASGFVVPLPEVLPQKFTIEIDVINRNSMGAAARTVKIYGGLLPRTDMDVDRTRVVYGHLGYEITGGGTTSESVFTSEEAHAAMGQPVSVRILGDSAYLKLYADGRRLSNVPNANFLRARGLYIALEGRDAESGAVYVTRIRVAESQRTIYDALKTTGRWATQGILFETGKAEIRPESAPTLKQIGDALKEHPELRVRIEGHTDNVGTADANLALSEARAVAVKNRLVSEFGIDAARLESVGLGDTKPATPNTTPEGRANNRRVEVVKL
jgi:OOP family OmpA-OmpF porin